jgi:hypothetical protein
MGVNLVRRCPLLRNNLINDVIRVVFFVFASPILKKLPCVWALQEALWMGGQRENVKV